MSLTMCDIVWHVFKLDVNGIILYMSFHTLILLFNISFVRTVPLIDIVFIHLASLLHSSQLHIRI